MKAKLTSYLRNWNIIRVVFLFMGSWMIFHSLKLSQWTGVLIGLYFVSMSIFNLGCAGNGGCFGGKCDIKKD